MGRVKAAYMAKTMDDMGPDEHPEWDINVPVPGTAPDDVYIGEGGEIPASVYRESILADFTSDELQAELKRRGQ